MNDQVVKIHPATKPQAKIMEERSSNETPQVKRRKYLLWSFVLYVIIPFSLVSCYFILIASDRFSTTVGFSVRGIDSGSNLDGLGALTGLASTGSTTADSYIVLGYLESRAIIEALNAEVGLRDAYSARDIDWLSRMQDDVTIEGFVNYWQRRISTQFDPASGIIEFSVQSFTSEHALQLAQRIIELTQALVNNLSSRARQDALQFAQEEVEIQEQRLRNTLETIKTFRTIEQSVDPTASASLDIQLLANLESRLIDTKAKISVQKQTLNDNAPSLVSLKRQAAALEQQIKDRRTQISGNADNATGTSTVTTQLSTYESLGIEQRIAEQSYASALGSLEQARRDANRQQRYLAVHLYPQSAEKSEYPKRLRNIVLAAFLLMATWIIGVLIAYSVRDHLT